MTRLVRRLAVALAIAVGVALLLMINWNGAKDALLLRTVAFALAGTAAFSLLEGFPARLPSWMQRWVLQVIAVALSVPIVVWSTYPPTPAGLAPGEYNDRMHLIFAALLVAPWTALVTVVRQKEAFTRTQGLAFALERSELERQALDARLHLMQAQVAPHFLFNTLANVQALVDAGSPLASRVLRTLVQYLRGAVPLLDEPSPTIERELQLVRPYLELMQMRMPDRLQYEIRVDPTALALRCPPTTLLTLVENAVRHGIDPTEEGGRIDIQVTRADGRCRIRVTDSGAGLRLQGGGLGTGLATLRERLRLAFGDGAKLRLEAASPRGVMAEVDMPEQR